jgi:hypothetical protein
MIPHNALFREINTLAEVFEGAVVDVDETLDLTAAALEEDDPAMERARLATRGFIHGRTIRWMIRVDTVLSLTVHELRSADEAILSVADHREALRAACARLTSIHTSSVTGELDDDNQVILIASSAFLHFHIAVVCRTNPGLIRADTIQRCAQAQCDLLKLT